MTDSLFLVVVVATISDVILLSVVILFLLVELSLSLDAKQPFSDIGLHFYKRKIIIYWKTKVKIIKYIMIDWIMGLFKITWFNYTLSLKASEKLRILQVLVLYWRYLVFIIVKTIYEK